MPVGLSAPEQISPVKGIRIAVESAGIYAKRRNDVALLEITENSHVAAVFTQNQFCAAPVIISKKHIKKASSRYCLINAGNANAGNGEQGIKDALICCERLSKLVGCKSEHVLLFSTGVIGEAFPLNKITTNFPTLLGKLKDNTWSELATAIMTTDILPKAFTKQIKLGGELVTISGVAKGSGMIKPNMATMLAFVATDANISKPLLEKLLEDAVQQSFNRIVVDGDTSTNDSCVLIATNRARNTTLNSTSDAYYAGFRNAIMQVFTSLAQAIVRDGEGATKFIEIEVSEGIKREDCLAIAYRIAESPLVKTAFTASDPNWGRILAAVGNASVSKLGINKVSIYLDDVCIVANGQRVTEYNEEASKKIMLQEEIKIRVQLGLGVEKETVWTTDLSHEYIKINAGYRT